MNKHTNGEPSIFLKDKPMGSHMIDWKYPVHPYAHTMIG